MYLCQQRNNPIGQTNAQLNQQKEKLIRFSFLNQDGNHDQYATIGGFDKDDSCFPRIYKCMGEVITIERDATWKATDSSKIIFDKLAAQLSLIPGIKAKQVSNVIGKETYNSGIEFTVDINVVPDFTYEKPGRDPNYDELRVVSNAESVRVICGQGHDSSYVINRITDKNNTPLQEGEPNTLLPINRFLV